MTDDQGPVGRGRGARRRGVIGAALLLGCAGPVASTGAQTVSAVVLCPDGQSLVGGRCVVAPVSSASGSAVASALPPLRHPAPVAVAGLGDLAPFIGRWLGEDSQGNAVYRLTVSSDGHFEQEIESLAGATGRSPGTCLQVGRARVEDGQIFWFFEQNSCNTDYENREDPDRISETGPRAFVLDIEGSYQIHYTRQ